jgi:hypothetical protein
MQVRKQSEIETAEMSTHDQTVVTPSGSVIAEKGDYIVTDSEGKKRVYEPNEFAETFYCYFNT